MTSTKTLLLAGTALFLVIAAAPVAPATASEARTTIAQAAPPHEGEKEKDKKVPAKGEEKNHRPEAQPQHQPPKAGTAPAPQKSIAVQPHEMPKAAQQPHELPKAVQQPHEPPKAAQQPHEMPKAAQQPHEAPKATPPQHQAEPRREERRPERPHDNAGKPEMKKPEAPANTATKPATAPVTKPAAAEQKPQPHQAPATQAKPAAPAAQPPAAQAPAAQKPAAQTAPATPAGNAQTNPPQNGNAHGPAPAAMAPPQKPQSAQQFILPKNGKPTATIQDLRKERHETREGNRTVITEGNRTIVKQDNRTIIRHNETQRFAVGARDVNVERRGNETTTVIVRPDGDRIINVTDDRGHLIRRVRRERDGREIVIIDERSTGPRRGDVFVELPPPVIHIPRDRYIVELDRARPEAVYDVLDAPPVERVEQSYTVDQVRYSAPLRERMPRIDLDINFDTGSWQLTPEQIDKLSVVAEGLNRAIRRNPREVFLIEGHTDAVGSAEDNLSLSDRRAESVAVALTEQFHVPPENLVTQGYGEQNLKVQTEGAERANRRVSVRRITPLIDQQARR